MSSVEKKVQKKIEAKKVLNIKITTQQDLYQKQEYSSFRKKLQEIKTKSNLQGFELETFGQIYNIDWLYQITHTQRGASFILYSTKMPLYIGFSFNYPLKLYRLMIPKNERTAEAGKKKSKKSIKIEKAKREKLLNRFITNKAIEVMEFLWKQWPFFQDHHIKYINEDHIAVYKDENATGIHADSVPLIISKSRLSSSLPPLGNALSSEAAITPKSINLPIIAIGERIIVEGDYVKIQSNKIEKQISAHHLNKTDYVVFANNNVFIQKDNNRYKLIYGVISVEPTDEKDTKKLWYEPFVIDDTHSTTAMRYPTIEVSAHSVNWESMDNTATGINLTTMLQLPLFGFIRLFGRHRHGISGERTLKNTDHRSALDWFESSSGGFIVLRFVPYYPSIYLGWLMQYSNIHQWFTHDDNLRTTKIPNLVTSGAYLGLGLDARRHGLRLAYMPMTSYYTDITGFSHEVTFSYQYQWGFNTKILLSGYYRLDGLELNDYTNNKIRKMGISSFAFGLGVSYELGFEGRNPPIKIKSPKSEKTK